MRMQRLNRSMFLSSLALLLLATPVSAVTPEWVNYQGVLRDAAGNPRDGSVDMVFRFYDAPTAGNQILVDQHLAAGTGSVQVVRGLFTVPLGSGQVSDGSAVLPGDPYTSLAAVFRDFPIVWMEIEITAGGLPETLDPRIHIRTVPYSFESDHAAEADAAIDAENADLALEAIHASSADTAASAGSATNSAQLGGLPASSYLNTGATTQTKAGALIVNGTLTAGGNALVFGNPGANISTFATGMRLDGGDAATDDLLLRAALGPDANGLVTIEGQGPVTLSPGNGVVNFRNAPTAALLASLDATGTFTTQGDLVAVGNHLRFGSVGPVMTAGASSLSVLAGDADTDDLSLVAGNDLADGAILMQGDGPVFYYSGDGFFRFVNGNTSTVTATLADTGDLSVGGDIVAINNLFAMGDSLLFGQPNARVTASAVGLELWAGDANTDSLILRAGNDFTDGSVDIIGDGAMTLRAGNGTFNFINGSTGGTLATLGATGTLNATQDVVAGRDLVAAADVVAQGFEVHLGAPGSTRIVRNPVNDDVYIARDEDQNNAASTFTIFTNVGIAQMRINDGDEAPAFFDGAVNANGLDYAEAFSISDPTLSGGEVVVFDPSRPGFIARADEAYSTRLAGVISEKPGFLTGGSFDAEEAADPELAAGMQAAYGAGDYATAKEISLVLERKKIERQRPVALAGRLPIKVDASYGPIRAGDHLTSSATPGYAMRMSQTGPSIGVALEGFDGPGTGTILAFVQRGHYMPVELLEATREAQTQLAGTLAARTPDPSTGVQVMPASLQIVLDASKAEAARFSVFRDGEADQPRSEVFRVDERGDVWAQGAFRPRSMDVAEAFRVSEPVEPGDVLVSDREHPGRYAKSRDAADPAVVGVVASDPGVMLGGDMSRLLNESPDLVETLAAARRRNDRQEERRVWDEVERRFRAAHAAVALTGTVLVKVDATHGAIRTGDLLTASPTPGHAMRAPSPAPEGTVVGKALEPLETGTGSIRMLVLLR